MEEEKNGRGKIVFSGQSEVMDILQKIGHIPLPPYIKRKDEPLDRDRYQTIFAERDGSIAAPTAGLHFTHSLLQSLRDQGVNIASITLHIGIGTFTPVKVKEIEDHTMGAEWIEIPERTAREIENTKQRGGRVIAVGNHDDAGPRILLRWKWRREIRERDVFIIHPSSLSFSRDRWIGHQLSSSKIDIDHVGIRLCRKRLVNEGLWRGH